jgi:hypothetical protein
MIRSHDVRQLTTAELERTKRELQANLGLIDPDSPAHVPIQAHIRAIDTELSQRAGNQQGSGDQCPDNQRPPGPPFPYCPADPEPEHEKAPGPCGTGYGTGRA